MNKCMLRLAAASALVFGAAIAAPAQAVDLRSWDRKYDLASDRFQVLAAFNKEAVLDRETQLVWERSPPTTLRNWYDANRHCSLHKTLGDRRGWRLPFAYELNSLVKPYLTLSEPRLPAGHPFENVSGAFWTATTDDFGDAYTVYFSGIYTYSNPPRTAAYRVWCVRGGGAFVPF